MTVTKASGEWQHLKPALLGAIMEHFTSGAPVMTSGAALAAKPRRRVLRRGRSRDRGHYQGADRNPRPARGRQRRRRHHLQRLQGWGGLPQHARLLCRMPVLHGPRSSTVFRTSSSTSCLRFARWRRSPPDPATTGCAFLALDTALGQCAACVIESGAAEPLGLEEIALERGHAEALLPLLEKVVSQAGGGFASLDRVVVTIGPGSFTGLRIGISAARAIRAGDRHPSRRRDDPSRP